MDSLRSRNQELLSRLRSRNPICRSPPSEKLLPRLVPDPVQQALRPWTTNPPIVTTWTNDRALLEKGYKKWPQGRINLQDGSNTAADIDEFVQHRTVEYKSCGLDSTDLWETYREEFANFTMQAFECCDKTSIQNLRALLQTLGVQVHECAAATASLYLTLQDNNPPWLPKSYTGTAIEEPANAANPVEDLTDRSLIHAIIGANPTTTNTPDSPSIVPEVPIVYTQPPALHQARGQTDPSLSPLGLVLQEETNNAIKDSADQSLAHTIANSCLTTASETVLRPQSSHSPSPNED